MDSVTDKLPPEIAIAVGYAPQIWRAHWHALFALDQRLAKLVSTTSEPMLAQIKLAWWRDRLSESVDRRPNGDQVLDQLRLWAGSEKPLIALINAWEVLVTDDLDKGRVSEFLSGRAEPFAELAKIAGFAELEEAALRVGKIWALSDLVAHLSNQDERTELLTEFSELGESQTSNWPKDIRPLAVLEVLAKRHLSSPDKPILTRRRDALLALRAGLIGR